MEKIISLFQRNYDGDRLVRDEIVPGAEWVLAGEGVATRKWDGTCCMVREGKLYKRYTLKRGRTAPAAFEPATELDAATGKQEGWVPVGDGPEDTHHRLGYEFSHLLSDGTYELIGPGIQGNPEQCDRLMMVAHGACGHPSVPRTFGALRTYFETHDIEGIVWHHPDGRMVKIKGKDFGINRTIESP
jgi:hypothetical protein